jgi:hypothetical protein
VNEELESMLKEVDVAQYKVLSQRLLGGSLEDYLKLSQDCRSPGRDLNLGPAEYKVGLLTTRPRRSVLGTKNAPEKSRLHSAHGVTTQIIMDNLQLCSNLISS